MTSCYFRLFEELASHLARLKDKASLRLNDFIQPVLVLESRINTVDALEPNILSNAIQVFIADKLGTFLLSVHDRHTAMSIR